MGIGPQATADHLFTAGFRGESLVIMTAICGAESGYEPANIGDETLQDGTWGPSVGISQIRTLKGETNRGTDRDILALRPGTQLPVPEHDVPASWPGNGFVGRQAEATFRISGGGINFNPWTAYTAGAWRKHEAEARAAAGNAKPTTGGDPGQVDEGLGPLPGAGLLKDALRASIERVLSVPIPEATIRSLEVMGGAAIMAIGLVMILEIVSTPAGRQAGGLISSTTRKAVGLATRGTL